MPSVKTLLDLGRVKCCTDAELGRRAGLSRAQVADLRSGRLVMSPETVATLCDVLELPGDAAREWIAVSLIENPKNAKIAERLRRALFACWVLGVGALLAPNDAQGRSAGYTARADNFTGYTSSRIRRWIKMRFALLCYASEQGVDGASRRRASPVNRWVDGASRRRASPVA